MASGAASNSPRNFDSARLRSVMSRMALETSSRLRSSSPVLSFMISSAACLRAVMSRMAPETSMPSSVSRGLRLISTGNSQPSLCKPNSSSPAPIGLMRGSAKKPVRCSGCRPRKRSGTSFSIGSPNNSSRRYPNNFSTWALTRAILPSWSTTTMASGAVSNRPRNLCSVRWRAITSASSCRLRVSSCAVRSVTRCSSSWLNVRISDRAWCRSLSMRCSDWTFHQTRSTNTIMMEPVKIAWAYSALKRPRLNPNMRNQPKTIGIIKAAGSKRRAMRPPRLSLPSTAINPASGRDSRRPTASRSTGNAVCQDSFKRPGIP